MGGLLALNVHIANPRQGEARASQRLEGYGPDSDGCSFGPGPRAPIGRYSRRS